MKIVKNIIFSLFAILFINGGLDKFLHYMPVPPDMPEDLIKDSTAMMEIAWLMPLVGCVELLGGLLILIPKTRALGALVVFPILVGILLTHVTVAPEGLIIAIVLWVILIWMLIDKKSRLLPIIQ